jgi:hypothetical protein
MDGNYLGFMKVLSRVLGWISEKLAAVPKEQSAPKSGKNAIC